MYRKKRTEHAEKQRLKRPLLCAVLALIVVCIVAAPAVVHRVKLSLYPCRYADYVQQYAKEYEIDPLAVYTIIRTESGFDPEATSGVDARGLMQITEDTFAWIKLKIARDEAITFEDLYDPQINIRFGAYYFSRCLARYGDLATAAAAYHSGWGTVDTLLEQEAYALDEHTLQTFPYRQMNLYVYKVTHAYQEYQTLYAQS